MDARTVRYLSLSMVWALGWGCGESSSASDDLDASVILGDASDVGQVPSGGTGGSGDAGGGGTGGSGTDGVDGGGLGDAGQAHDAGDPDAGSWPALSVLSVSPVADSSDAAPETAIEVTFSRPMEASSIDATTFLLTQGAPIDGTVSYDAETRTARFVPATPLSLLGHYTATVTAGAQDAEGNPLETDHTWEFSVRDGEWTAPSRINDDDDDDIEYPEVAVDPWGRAVAVWTWRATYDAIATSRLESDQTTWEPSHTLSDPTTDAQDPAVAVDPSGNATALFRHYDTGDAVWRLYASHRPPSGSWSARSPISDVSATAIGELRVAADGAGNVVGVWNERHDGRWYIWSSRYVPGAGWASAEQISTNAAGDAHSPKVAVSAAGDATAVWHESDGTLFEIWANRYVAGEGWGTAQRVGAAPDANNYIPQVGVDAAGNAIVVWYSFSDTRNVWANRYVVGEGWQEAARIEDLAGESHNPRLAVDPAGNAIVVWSQIDTGAALAWHRRYVNGSGWLDPERLDTTDAGDAQEARVMLDHAGHGLATWQQDGQQMWVRRFHAETGWAAPGPLSHAGAIDVSSSVLTISPNGRAALVWQGTTTASEGRVDGWASVFR